jgi:hypothetical protein
MLVGRLGSTSAPRHGATRAAGEAGDIITGTQPGDYPLCAGDTPEICGAPGVEVAARHGTASRFSSVTWSKK